MAVDDNLIGLCGHCAFGLNFRTMLQTVSLLVFSVVAIVLYVSSWLCLDVLISPCWQSQDECLYLHSSLKCY